MKKIVEITSKKIEIKNKIKEIMCANCIYLNECNDEFSKNCPIYMNIITECEKNTVKFCEECNLRFICINFCYPMKLLIEKKIKEILQNIEE